MISTTMGYLYQTYQKHLGSEDKLIYYFHQLISIHYHISGQLFFPQIPVELVTLKTTLCRHATDDCYHAVAVTVLYCRIIPDVVQRNKICQQHKRPFLIHTVMYGSTENIPLLKTVYIVRLTCTSLGKVRHQCYKKNILLTDNINRRFLLPCSLSDNSCYCYLSRWKFVRI